MEILQKREVEIITPPANIQKMVHFWLPSQGDTGYLFISDLPSDMNQAYFRLLLGNQNIEHPVYSFKFDPKWFDSKMRIEIASQEDFENGLLVKFDTSKKGLFYSSIERKEINEIFLKEMEPLRSEERTTVETQVENLEFIGTMFVGFGNEFPHASRLWKDIKGDGYVWEPKFNEKKVLINTPEIVWEQYYWLKMPSLANMGNFYKCIDKIKEEIKYENIFESFS